MQAHPEVVFRIVMDLQLLRAEWDCEIAHADIIETVDCYTDVVRIVYRAKSLTPYMARLQTHPFVSIMFISSRNDMNFRTSDHLFEARMC